MAKKITNAQHADAVDASAKAGADDAYVAHEAQAIPGILEALAVQFTGDFASRWVLDAVGNGAHRLAARMREDHDASQAKWLAATENRETDSPSEVSEVTLERLADRMNRAAADEETARRIVAEVTALLSDVFKVEWKPLAERTAGARPVSAVAALRARVAAR